MSYPVNPPPPPGGGSVPPPPPGYGTAPPPPQPGYGPAPHQGYDPAPQPGYGPAPQQGFGPTPEPGTGSAPEQGFGPAPQSPEQGFGPAPAPAAPPKKSKGKRVLGILAVILVALVVGGLKFGVASLVANAFFGDKAKDAKVGDCIAQMPSVAVGEQTEADAKVVDCTAGDAAFTVVGRVENQTQAQAKDSTECEQYVKEGEEYSVYYSIPDGGTGYLLCLKPKA